MKKDSQTEKSKGYHHGDLRGALLAAAEEELSEKGPEKFSLRGCAKRAGVSHAAPAHHFKDTNALLQALAGTGFERLTAMMREEQVTAARGEPASSFVAAGIGYIRFAMENPQLFQLMFGGHASAVTDRDLMRNGDEAFSTLVNAVARMLGSQSLKTEEGWSIVTTGWSLVHGYAQLAISKHMGYVTARPFEEQREAIRDMLMRIAPKT